MERHLQKPKKRPTTMSNKKNEQKSIPQKKKARMPPQPGASAGRVVSKKAHSRARPPSPQSSPSSLHLIQEETKPHRRPQWRSEEFQALLHSANTHREVLRGKFAGSAGGVERRAAAWEAVVSDVNSVSEYHRTISECQRKVAHFGSEAKAKNTALIQQYGKTGAGAIPPHAEMTRLEKMALDYYGAECVTGIPGLQAAPVRERPAHLSEEQPAAAATGWDPHRPDRPIYVDSGIVGKEHSGPGATSTDSSVAGSISDEVILDSSPEEFAYSPQRVERNVGTESIQEILNSMMPGSRASSSNSPVSEIISRDASVSASDDSEAETSVHVKEVPSIAKKVQQYQGDTDTDDVPSDLLELLRSLDSRAETLIEVHRRLVSSTEKTASFMEKWFERYEPRPVLPTDAEKPGNLSFSDGKKTEVDNSNGKERSTRSTTRKTGRAKKSAPERRVKNVGTQKSKR